MSPHCRRTLEHPSSGSEVCTQDSLRRTCLCASASALARFSWKPIWHPGTRCLDLELACHGQDFQSQNPDRRLFQSNVYTSSLNVLYYKSLGNDKTQLQNQSKTGGLTSLCSCSTQDGVRPIPTPHEVAPNMCVSQHWRRRHRKMRHSVILGCVGISMRAWAT